MEMHARQHGLDEQIQPPPRTPRTPRTPRNTSLQRMQSSPPYKGTHKGTRRHSTLLHTLPAKAHLGSLRPFPSPSGAVCLCTDVVFLLSFFPSFLLSPRYSLIWNVAMDQLYWSLHPPVNWRSKSKPNAINLVFPPKSKTLASTAVPTNTHKFVICNKGLKFAFVPLVA